MKWPGFILCWRGEHEWEPLEPEDEDGVLPYICARPGCLAIKYEQN